MDIKNEQPMETKDNGSKSNKLSGWLNTGPKKLLAFALIFAVIGGGVMAYMSFAATETLVVNKTLPEERLEGQLEYIHGDDLENNKKVFEEFTLISADGVRTPLDFDDEKPSYSGVAQVVVKGTRENGRLKVNNGGIEVKQIAELYNTNLKTAVILFNFKNSPSDQPISKEYAMQQVFTDKQSVNAFFKEESFGQVNLTGIENPSGDVFGYYTIDDTSKCSFEVIRDWQDKASALATADGHDLSKYDRVTFVSPANCGRIHGVADGGRESMIFANSSLKGYTPNTMFGAVLKHEMTHNFGTNHANSYSCVTTNTNNPVPVPISDNCKFIEYGDSHDVVGGSIYQGRTNHSNNYLLHKVGFIADDSITTINKSGDYLLTPIQGTKVKPNSTIRLIRSIDKFNNILYYYLEYRQPFGAFDNLALTDPAVQGTTIRVTGGDNEDWQSGVVDVHAKAPSIKGKTNVYQPVMIDGDVFEDATNGNYTIKITQLSHNKYGVKLHIDVSNVPQSDKTVPSAPINLKLIDASNKTITIDWNASNETDISHYLVYRGDILIGRAYRLKGESKVNFKDFNSFKVGETITYTIKTRDYAGNVSASSLPLTVVVPKQ